MRKLLRAAGALWLVIGLLLANPAWSESLDVLRMRYAELKQAWDQHRMDKVAELMPQLHDYPLYPYLQYRQLNDQLATVSTAQISKFVQTYPTLSVTSTLISRFVNELARRKDWQTLLAFSPQPPVSDTAQCNYYLAKWHSGQRPDAWQGARELWLRDKMQLSACHELFVAWQASGDMQKQDYQQRILQAVKKNDWQQVSLLTEQMSGHLHTPSSPLTNALQMLSKTPDDLLTFVRNAPASAFIRNLVNSRFTSLARKDVQQAVQLLPVLKQTLYTDATDYQQLKEILAWQLMSTTTGQQAHWRDEVIAHSQSTALTERRIRLALAKNDQLALKRWLAHLSASAREKDEWRYWQAIVLQRDNQPQQAQQLLRALSRKRGFYPMLAAQQLAQPYNFKTDHAPAISETRVYNKTLARIRELKYWKQDNTALSEWRALVTPLSALEQAELARYADTVQWWDLSVQATIIGKLWDHLRLRFPLAYQPLFHHYLADKDISLSYTMAIARQESAWNPQVRSPAGATGLMQLMPATAKQTAKKFHIVDYHHINQLQDPAINIKIGTLYLQQVYQQFSANRILAAAAYNAGPARVRSWLASSNGNLDAAAFIESIPFAETRGYVKNVLAYDAYYRHFMGVKQAILLTPGEWLQNY